MRCLQKRCYGQLLVVILIAKLPVTFKGVMQRWCSLNRWCEAAGGLGASAMVSAAGEIGGSAPRWATVCRVVRGDAAG